MVSNTFPSLWVIPKFVFESDFRALGMVCTQDAKFRIYDNTTVPLHDSSGKQTGTYTFSGSFVWIHFNVFAVKPLWTRFSNMQGAWAFLSMTGLYIYAFLKKHWHGYHTSIDSIDRVNSSCGTFH